MPTKEEILELQHALRQQGSYLLARTGVMDGGTQAALLDYQQRRGVEATGKLDGPTRVALGWTIADEA